MRTSGLLACLLVVAACGRQPQREAAAPAESLQRQQVRGFWRTLQQAGEARLRHDCAGAVPLYEQALAHDERHEDALYYLGQCQRELARPREARESFERLVAVNDASARGHLALGALLASPDAREPMDLAAAERHLRRAHAVNGEETGPVVRLGEVLLVSGREPDAGRAFEAALRTNPKSLEAALLAAFVAWDSRSPDRQRLLAERLRAAAKVDAPVKGVLNEGDRKDAQRQLAPPLENPLGRLLFEASVASVRSRVRSGRALDDAFLAAAYRDTRRLCEGLRARSRKEALFAPATMTVAR